MQHLHVDSDQLNCFVMLLLLFQNLDCVKQMKAMLEEKCKQCAAAQLDKFKKLLGDSDHHVGYLVNERFLNLPPNLAVPMFESLM